MHIDSNLLETAYFLIRILWSMFLKYLFLLNLPMKSSKESLKSIVTMSTFCFLS